MGAHENSSQTVYELSDDDMLGADALYEQEKRVGPGMYANILP